MDSSVAISLSPDRPVGAEARKSLRAKMANGFIERYLSGPNILDIGYKGYLDDILPIVPQAIGVDLDYPGYDGSTLPFAEASQDAVYSSHCLEHIEDYRQAIRDWFRVLRPGGHLVIVVPHQFLYEKQSGLPSRWNADHKRLYTPASLLAEIEQSLDPNSYRVRLLADNDADFDYSIGPEQHSTGCYEIELVIEKLVPPTWDLAEPPPPVMEEPPPPPPEPPPPPPIPLHHQAMKAVGRWMPESLKTVLRPVVRRL